MWKQESKMRKKGQSHKGAQGPGRGAWPTGREKNACYNLNTAALLRRLVPWARAVSGQH